MIEIRETKVKQENFIESKRVYCEAYKQCYEFRQTVCNGVVKIKFIRAYVEDARYADKTHLQLAVSAIKEIVEVEKCDVVLEIWGRQIRFLSDTDEHEIQETLIDFILRNVLL